MNQSKRISRFSIFLFIFSFLLIATANAQVPAGINPNNLSTVNVDELSDDQIKMILQQGGANGISLEQGITLAKQRGLPDVEENKLRARLASLNNSPSTIKSIGQNPESTIIKKNETEAKTAEVTSGNVEDEKKVEAKSTIYGQQYFRSGDIKVFDRSIDAKAPSNYIIGVDDEIGVSVFGYSFYNELLRVDARGAINPQQMGPIFIKGLTYEKAKLLIRSKMSQYFDLSNNKLEVTLAYSRSITINIVGEVINPGSYKMPALNTAFNALILAGGPNDIGTLRNIQIRRNGKVVKTLDVYAFLNDPNSKQDFFLEDNDYIVVGSSSKIVSINGEVKRPAMFELTDKENLNALINYAGDLNPDAYREEIQIRRISAKESKIIDLNYDSLIRLKKDYILQAGDVINIRSSISEIINKITIKGAVNFAGDYNITGKERVIDLIKKAGGLKQDANLENAYIIRTKADQTKEYIRISLNDILTNKNSEQNIILQTKDVLNIYSYLDYIEPLGIQVLGAVRNASKFNYVSGMTLGDALQNAGGLSLDAENLRIEISRLSYFSPNYIDGQDVRVVIESIKLSDKNTVLYDEQSQIKLQPFDQIFVRRVPNFAFQENITLRGEVKYPGVYTLMSKDERIADVIKRAGGLSRFAFTEGATFYRPTLPGGYVVLNLKDALNGNNNKFNYILREGDVINIPTVSDFISIRGSSLQYIEVTDLSQVNAPYHSNKRAKFYINKFGNGFSKDAWKSKTYVIQPNAKINRTKNFGIIKIYPKVTKGSTIYVVQKEVKPEEIKKEREPFDWNKFIEKTTVKITGIATLFILLRQL